MRSVIFACTSSSPRLAISSAFEWYRAAARWISPEFVSCAWLSVTGFPFCSVNVSVVCSGGWQCTGGDLLYEDVLLNLAGRCQREFPDEVPGCRGLVRGEVFSAEGPQLVRSRTGEPGQ